jgi:hypothetical protein
MKIMFENLQQSDASEPGYHYMMDRDNGSAAAKQEGKEEDGI